MFQVTVRFADSLVDIVYRGSWDQSLVRIVLSVSQRYLTKVGKRPECLILARTTPQYLNFLMISSQTVPRQLEHVKRALL